MEHKIVIPKFDNSHNKIRKDLYDKYLDELIEYFGGITIIPKINGCWYNDKSTIECDEGFMIIVDRVFSENDKKNIDLIKKTEKQDQQKIINITKRIGDEFGQQAMFSTDIECNATYTSCKRKQKLSKGKIITPLQKLHDIID